ncbi:methyltransferase domain-containing protein [Ferrimonas marina]|uniref:Malonyl-CoA O-methyltransferase n=1 Tax=Ferrimonas marina TaxID=299255 RepID=A0A1M5YUB7_9GAMM|nr:methyltransferase domain-containing protein [Ferrimonas marina]SHI15656.1 malonyl-CoA O-methyltransferase [Ferrimonas marina]
MMGVAQCFSGAAKHYDAHAQLQRRVGRALLQRAQPADWWLDLGAGTGFLTEQLPGEGNLALDLAPAMLSQGRARGRIQQALLADIQALPLQPGSVPAMAANLSLQWCSNLTATLAGMRQAARPGAQLLATVPVAGCFPELRPLVANGSLGCRHFLSIEAVARAAIEAGWQQVAVHAQQEVVHFEDPRALLAHFKGTGAHHLAERHPGLRGRSWWQGVQRVLEQHRQAEGLPLTWQLGLLEAKA